MDGGGWIEDDGQRMLDEGWSMMDREFWMEDGGGWREDCGRRMMSIGWWMKDDG